MISANKNVILVKNRMRVKLIDPCLAREVTSCKQKMRELVLPSPLKPYPFMPSLLGLVCKSCRVFTSKKMFQRALQTTCQRKWTYPQRSKLCNLNFKATHALQIYDFLNSFVCLKPFVKYGTIFNCCFSKKVLNISNNNEICYQFLC